MSDHAELSASGASRWINCPGSVEAERGLPNPDSKYSIEGTAAHKLSEMSWSKQSDPSKWVGLTIDIDFEDKEGNVSVIPVKVNQEMADNVNFYHGVLRGLSVGARHVWTEQRISLQALKPPADMFATADFIAYLPDHAKLVVADLKYGKGVPVTAEYNWQTIYYAIGAWLKLAFENRSLANTLKEVQMVIVQPRILDDAGEPTVTEWTITLAQLKGYARQLMEAARIAMTPGVSRKSGKWCQFCRAKATCSTFRNESLAVAQVAFEDIAEPVILPSPGAMTTTQLAQVLELAPKLESWLGTMKAYATDLLERGEEVPGWALKAKRATRQWKDEDEVVAFATASGWPLEEVFDHTLKSPAQIEKLVGKKGLPDALIIKKSSGNKLCRDSDPDATEVEGFDALPNPE